MELKIALRQLEEVMSRKNQLLTTYKNPRARLLTDVQGWIIEVEQIQSNLEDKISALKKNVKDGIIVLNVVSKTGKNSGNQFFIKESNNSTYALQLTIQDQNKINVFPY